MVLFVAAIALTFTACGGAGSDFEGTWKVDISSIPNHTGLPDSYWTTAAKREVAGEYFLNFVFEDGGSILKIANVEFECEYEEGDDNAGKIIITQDGVDGEQEVQYRFKNDELTAVEFKGFFESPYNNDWIKYTKSEE